ncbi:MAG: transketolase [Bacteroidales bacterium]|nr:transketolase [Bacteroidales bacterium]
MTSSELKKMAQEIRKDIVRTTYSTGKNGAHIGGALSCADLLAVLYGEFIDLNKSDTSVRDRFIMSKGHAALAQYCALKQVGLLSQDDLDSFEKDGSEFVAHARHNTKKGLDFSGGSLGLGVSFAVGVALACKEKRMPNHIYVLLGDGECDEGIVWEALLFASHNKLNNMTIIVDYNHLQADGKIDEVVSLGNLLQKMQSFTDNALQIDGHDVDAIKRALEAPQTDMPKIVVAETVKGKGVSFIENKYNWHHGSLNEVKFNKAMAELETNGK